MRNPHAPTPGTTTYVPPPPPAPTLSLAQEFTKGVRRSISDYKTFREKRQWNQWNRSLRATGMAHGIDNIFDNTYTAVAANQVSLFNEQKKFAMSVFTSTLQEPESVSILRKYTDPNDATKFGDAQALYDELVTAMTQVQVGRAQVLELEKQFQNLRIDKDWTKTIAAFVTRVGHMIADHQGLVDRTLYPDSWYIARLNECLSTQREMRLYIHTLESQVQAIATATSTAPAAANYNTHYHNVMQHALIIDQQNKTMHNATPILV